MGNADGISTSVRFARRWLVCACVLGLSATACTRADSGAAQNTVPPEPSTTTVAPTTPATTLGVPSTIEPVLDFEVGRSDLRQFSPVPPGTYTMGELGVPVRFTVEDVWSTQPVAPGYFVITTPESFGPGDHDVVFLRPRTLIDATENTPTIEPGDLDGWLATVPEGVQVGRRTDTSVGGHDAVTFSVTVDADTTCVILDVSRCADLMFAGGSFLKAFDKGFLYEVWWVDTPETPVVIVVGTPTEDPDWLDVGRAVVASLELG